MNLLLAHPEAKILATAAVLRSLAATKYYFDRATNQMVHTPDFATQLAAAKLIFERTEGLPVQMNLNVNATAQSQKNLNTPAATVATLPATPVQLPKSLKLVFTKKELLAELGISETTLWRLEVRGLLSPMPGVRHKRYARSEVERFLRGSK